MQKKMLKIGDTVKIINNEIISIQPHPHYLGKTGELAGFKAHKKVLDENPNFTLNNNSGYNFVLIKLKNGVGITLSEFHVKLLIKDDKKICKKGIKK